MVTQRADFIIDNKPYTLARTGGDVGARAWQETGPQAAEVSQPLRDVARGELGKEVRILWSTKHRGFGEPLRTIEGRDYWGRDIDKRYPHQTTLARLQTALTGLPATIGADPTKFAELGGSLYLGYGTDVIKIASNDAVTSAFDIETAHTGIKAKGLATFQNTIFLGLGEATTFRHSTDGTTWTAHAGGFTATHFLPVQDRLYRMSKQGGTLAGSSATDLVVGDILSTNTDITVSVIAASGAKAQTYTFTSGGAGSLTLTGTDASAQTISGIEDTVAESSLALDFATLNVRVVLTTGPAVKLIADTITDLLAVANDTIVVSSSSTVATYLSNNSVDPTDSLNWSALDIIGDSGIPSTGLASVAYQLFVAKEDGLYAADIETGRFPSLTPELAAWRDTVNGKGAFGWGGLAFMPTVRGLKMYYAGQLFSAGPEAMSANDSEVVGYVTAMTGDANWLFATLYNGTDTYILAGRNPKPDDRYPGEFTWNVVWYMSGGPYTAMTISGLNNDPRLWVARNGDVRYIKLGDTLDNPLQDSAATYMATGTDYYPAHDGGSPMVDKHFLELRVSAEQLSYTCYITWSFKLDDETTWTELGKTKVSPVTVLKFDTATDVIGRRIELKAAYTRGATTTDTPIVRNVELLAVEYPSNRKLLSASFLVSDKTQTRTGVDPRAGHQVVADLEALVLDRKQVSLTDPLGRDNRALPLGPVLVKEVLSQDSREATVIVTAQYLIMED